VKLDAGQSVDNTLEAVRQMPGVVSATGAMLVPLSGDGWITEADFQSTRVPVHANAVLEEYFATLGIPVIEGRPLLATDRMGSQPVGVVNQTFARRYFGDTGAVGKSLRMLSGPHQYTTFQIVGVVADTKYNTLGEDTRLLVYRPFRQAGFGGATLHLRTAGPPAALIPSVRSAIGAMDRNAVVEVQTMRDSLAFALIPGRMAAVDLGAMGFLGLLLAVIGLYGTLAYAVSRRTAEIGIRVALGASRHEVLQLVLRDGAVLVLVGVAVGIAIAAAASLPLAQFVAGVKFSDPMTLLPVAVMMLLVGAAASAIPARRATRVDPIVALRYE
jgi:putative ABC transport system permease protein